MIFFMIPNGSSLIIPQLNSIFIDYKCKLVNTDSLKGQLKYLSPKAYLIEGLPPEIYQHLPSVLSPAASIETLMCTFRRVSKDYVASKRKNRDATLTHISNNITIAFAQIDDLALRDNTDVARAQVHEKIRCYQAEYAEILKDSVSHNKLTESTRKLLDQETPSKTLSKD